MVEGVESVDGEVIAEVRAAAAVSICQKGGVAECRSGRGRSLHLAGMVHGLSSDVVVGIGGYGALSCRGSKYWGGSGVVATSASTPRSKRSALSVALWFVGTTPHQIEHGVRS